MTAETILPSQNGDGTQSPGDRKRHLSGEPQQAKSQKEMASDAKRPKKVTNDGWGDLFKNRENFVEMHLC